MFAVSDRFGDVETFSSGELGLYYQDTRFLSRLSLKLGKDRPLLLSSTVREDNAIMAVDATNADVWRDSEIVVPRGTIHVYRSKVLWNKACNERQFNDWVNRSLSDLHMMRTETQYGPYPYAGVPWSRSRFCRSFFRR